MKFSAEFQREFSLEQIASEPVKWADIDMTIVSYLLAHGASVHDHGDVEHLHDYAFMASVFRAFGLWGGGAVP